MISEPTTIASAEKLGSSSITGSQQQTPSTLNPDGNPIAEMLNAMAKFFQQQTLQATLQMPIAQYLSINKPIKLTRDNDYEAWKWQIKFILTRNDLQYYIKTDEADTKESKSITKEDDNMIHIWILQYM